MAQVKLDGNVMGKDTDTFTHEERVENGRKGGINSGKARRERKQMREVLNHLLYIPLKKNMKKTDADKLKSIDSASNANLDSQTMMLLSILKKAIKGDVVAATFIRDTLGENPFIVADREKRQETFIDDSVEETSYLEDIKSMLQDRKVDGIDDE